MKILIIIFMFMYVVFISHNMNTKIGTKAAYYIAQTLLGIAYIASCLALIWKVW